MDNWPTLREVRERTGMSERTIYRRMQDDPPLRHAYRKVLGRKPLLCFNPEDVSRLEAETLKPIVMDEAQPAISAVTLPKAGLPDFLEKIQQAADHWQLKRKPILTLAEAAQVTGYSKAYLERARDEGRLPAFLDGAWKVRQQALRHFAATDSMTTLPRKLLKKKKPASLPANGSMTA